MTPMSCAELFRNWLEEVLGSGAHDIGVIDLPASFIDLTAILYLFVNIVITWRFYFKHKAPKLRKGAPRLEIPPMLRRQLPLQPSNSFRSSVTSVVSDISDCFAKACVGSENEDLRYEPDEEPACENDVGFQDASIQASPTSCGMQVETIAQQAGSPASGPNHVSLPEDCSSGSQQHDGRILVDL